MLEDSIGLSIPAHTCPWGRCCLHGAVPYSGSLVAKERHKREFSETAEAKIRPTARLQRHTRHLEISSSLALAARRNRLPSLDRSPHTNASAM